MKKILSEKSSIGSCKECIHFYFDENLSVCKAFTKGIPRNLYWKAHSHKTILPEQEGDYVFEMKERYKKVYKKIEKSKKELEAQKQKEQSKSSKKSFWKRLFRKK